MQAIKNLHTSLIIAIVVSAISATPIAEEIKDFSNYPDIIPGPGMPSLESLGLTSADIYRQTFERLAAQSKTTPADNKTSLEQRAPPGFPTCDNFARCPDYQGAACNTYLYNLGTTNCVVAGVNQKFCSSGACHVWGTSLSGRTLSSWCRDVAAGTKWVLDNCSSGGQTQGTGVTWGNGDLLVTINAYA